MKSKMSFCNGALLRRILTRTVLLWGAYLVIWLVCLPGNILTVSEWKSAVEMKQVVLRAAANCCHVVPFFYGLAMAWFLFLYLYRSRSVNFFAALPLRRETMFWTNCVAGILCAVVPNFLIMGAILAAGAAGGVNLATESAIWFAANTMGFVFYFGLAVLCTMGVGNLVAMPCLYMVLNFVVVVVETVVKALLQSLLYGFRFEGGPVLAPLSPFYHAVVDSNGPDCVSHWGEGTLLDVTFEGWGGLLILTAVGIVFSVIAYFLYKHRRMEVAGDVIAIKPLKPVFLYMFTFGFGLVGGIFLSSALLNEMSSSYFLPIAASLIICTAVGFFLGEMILLRTLRVFRKRNWLRCGICVIIAAVSLLCVRMDLFGVESYVPAADEVVGVRLTRGRHNVEDPARIQQVMDLHEEILERKTETEAACRQGGWIPEIEIIYVLKNGEEVERAYHLPVAKDEPADPDSLIYKYEEINNTTEMILSRELPRQEMTAANIHNCHIYYYISETQVNGSLDPDAWTALQLWNEAMLPDLMAGDMGTEYQSYQMAETKEVAATYSDVTVEFELYDEEHTEYYHYTIPVTATRTMAALMEMGVPEAAFRNSID